MLPWQSQKSEKLLDKNADHAPKEAEIWYRLYYCFSLCGHYIATASNQKAMFCHLKWWEIVTHPAFEYAEVIRRTPKQGTIISSSGCDADSFMIRDGVCDEITNTERCLYDGGDCCKEDKSTELCNVCTCKKKTTDTDFWMKSCNKRTLLYVRKRRIFTESASSAFGIEISVAGL